MRIKAASPQEREQLLEQLIQIGDGLAELDALPPDPERLVFAADRAGFGMKTTLELLETLLAEAAATVTSAAETALPTQSELAAWIGAGNCPPETLASEAGWAFCVTQAQTAGRTRIAHLQAHLEAQ